MLNMKVEDFSSVFAFKIVESMVVCTTFVAPTNETYKIRVAEEHCNTFKSFTFDYLLN